MMLKVVRNVGKRTFPGLSYVLGGGEGVDVNLGQGFLGSQVTLGSIGGPGPISHGCIVCPPSTMATQILLMLCLKAKA